MSQRLSALDAAFLNAETACTPMHIGGLLIFRSPPEVPGRPGLDALFATVQERLPLIPRCRQVLVPVPFGLGLPVWADASRFDIRRHLRRVRLPAPGDRRTLLEMVGRLHARRVDRSRPMWEMYLVDGLANDEVAVYAKLHHAMADGISAVELGLVLLDLDPHGENTPELPAPPPARRPPTSLALLASGPLEAADQAVTWVRRAAAPLPWPVGGGDARTLNGGSLRRALTEPSGGSTREVVGAAREAAATAARGAAASAAAGVGAALSMRELGSVLRPAPPSPFNQPVGEKRRVEIVQLPLGGAKTIKNGLGGTINDVILAVVAEAIHIFLERRGEASDGLRYRVMVPMSVRDDNEKIDLDNRLQQKLEIHNRLIGTFVELPVGPMAAGRRLWAIRQIMGKAKTAQASAAARVLDLASMSPAAVQRATIRAGLAGQRVVNMVVSNVPGVQIPVYAGGSRLLEVYPTLPLTPNTGVIICVLSYDNNLHFGLVGDPEILPDLDVLGDGLRLAFGRLRKAAGEGAPQAPVRRRRPARAREPVPT